MDILVVIVMVIASFSLGAIISKYASSYSWARWIDKQFRPVGTIVYNDKDGNSLYLEWDENVDLDQALSKPYITFHVRETNKTHNDR